MKEESREVKLSLGDVSLSEKLDVYYIDMRPAMVHYTNNIYDGKFDENGVPMSGDGKGTYCYFPVNIIQYAFMLHADYLDSPKEDTLNTLKNCLKVLESLKTENENTVAWYHSEFNIKYKINAPWVSAMDQGEAISFYLRMYQILNQESLLITAQKAYNFFRIDYKDSGFKRVDENGNLWFEEYPSNPPSYVLNGFIYAIFGLYDLYRVTKNEVVKNDIDACIKTLKENLHRFDTGYWSNYDLLKKELVRYYYQKNVHVPQLDVLHKLSGEIIFLEYKKKWERNLNPINFLFVQIMYRLKPRFQKIQKIFGS